MQNHKEIVRNFYDAIWNNADKTVIPDLLTEDFLFRGSLGLMQRGHDGFANFMDQVRAALGEYRCDIVDMAAEGNKVFARMLYSGVHRGDLFGYAATHARIKWDGVAIFTFRDGKISELWVLWDVNDVMKQLARFVMD
ncbi:MAG TPA: ester cyclase [Methylophilaceae bacterium]|jgi:steroid delta-isomerase-like uncharacterized protein|uniref:ester cyclase n=1 Tax=Methylobacillus sp. MM3 TaxID=1848039 RepID=UPI0007DF7C50|nr:ester cyclase [Methylobacillus sp. MM3]OAJ70929.1 hypothetical protein A7976_05625 [Methylobacillus sp. MM3]HSI23501.1 ester cyclase [Methylophilaceae bacterium]